eukprot:1009266-Ditylum_brightwellii.AAC.1
MAKTKKAATIPSTITTISTSEDQSTQSKLPAKQSSKTPKGTQAKWLTPKQKKVDNQDCREIKLKKQSKNSKK